MMCWKRVNYSLLVSLFTSVLAFAVLVLLIHVMQLPCCDKRRSLAEEDIAGHNIILRRNKGRFRSPDYVWHEEKKRRKMFNNVRSQLDMIDDYTEELSPLDNNENKPERSENLMKRIPNFAKLSHPVLLQRSLRDIQDEDGDNDSADDADGDEANDVGDDYILTVEAAATTSSNPLSSWLDLSTVPECNDNGCSEYLSHLSQSRFHSCIQLVKNKNATLQDGKCHFVDRTSRKPVALVSFPGSGNTWARGLLETTTGICTGAVYCDISLRAQGFVGEYIREASTLVVKTHENEPRWLGVKQYRLKFNQGVYGSAIFLVRNPFRALVAEWNRKVANNFRTRTVSFDTHIRSAGEEWFGNNTKWEKYVFQQAQRWQIMIKNWIMNNNRHPVLLVKYEELKNSTLPEVKRMLDFLQVKYNDELLEEKLNDNSFNRFHRNHKNGKFVHYTSEQAEYVRAIIKDTIYLLEENNLGQLIDMTSYYNME